MLFVCSVLRTIGRLRELEIMFREDGRAFEETVKTERSGMTRERNMENIPRVWGVELVGVEALGRLILIRDDGEICAWMRSSGNAQMRRCGNIVSICLPLPQSLVDHVPVLFSSI